ncbi:hypothetical protein [Streptomyces sennicomposti]|uniref:hypothetical protein n=1 Tax=Streptomyces sennicomposti TaxID=2873384 RepID=UPI001FFCE067|nr:hypothetical protein [Streptomyces sennicomposti]
MTMTPQQLRDQEPTLELINTELASRMARQSESGAKVDTKTVFLVGFAATATQFLASRSFEPFTGTAAFAAYAVAIGYGIAIFNLAEYEDIKPREVLDTHGRSTKGAALVALAATRVGMFEKNAHLHARKTRRWTVSLTMLVIGVCLSTASILLHTDVHGRHAEPGEPSPSPSTSSASTQSYGYLRRSDPRWHGEEG